MDLRIGAIEEIGDYFRALPFGMIGLEVEPGIFLVAFGGKADVVQLHFINSGLGYELGEGDVIVLPLGARGVGSDEFAVFAPALPGPMRLYGQFGMGGDQWLITEHGAARRGLPVFSM